MWWHLYKSDDIVSTCKCLITLMFDFHPCGYKLDKRSDGTNKGLIFTYDFVLTFMYFNKALMVFVSMCYQH